MMKLILLKSKIRFALACLFMTLALAMNSGCAQKKIDPMALAIEDLDKQEAAFAPSPNELTHAPGSILPLVTHAEATMTKTRTQGVMAFLSNQFKEHGNIHFLPEQKLKQAQAMIRQDQLQPDNIADALKLGRHFKSNLVAQIQMSILSSKAKNSVDHFKARINLTILTASSGQVVMKKDFEYNSLKIAKSKKVIKFAIQENFPVQGFILETRGSRQVAKISVGRSLGIEQGRKFLIRERKVVNQLVLGMARKVISYEGKALAEAKVFLVGENHAWIKIDKSLKHRIKKGHSVFAKPEKSGLF